MDSADPVAVTEVMTTENREMGQATEVKMVRLLALDLPKQACYELRLGAGQGRYLVTKTSGCRSGPLDTRSWWFATLATAERSYDQIIKRKTNPAVGGGVTALIPRQGRGGAATPLLCPVPTLTRQRRRDRETIC
jgi:hypothetical protein